MSSRNTLTASPLISQSELLALQIQAGQIDTSANSSHKLDSRDAGWLPTNTLGSGMDYAESRVYQQGDDPRTINWRLSARSTNTYVKNYHMESRPELCIMLDQRRPMIFGTRKRLKATQALRLASVLAFAAEQHRLSLQIVLINDDVHWLGKQSIEGFLKQSNHAALPTEVKPQVAINEVLEQITTRLKEGSLLYLVSDFMDLETSHKRLLVQLQEYFFVHALHIIDPAERQYKKVGGVQLQDMYAENSIYLSPDQQDMSANLNHIASEHFNAIHETLIKAAVSYSAILSDEESIHAYISLPLGH